jgi:hypothetical protein
MTGNRRSVGQSLRRLRLRHPPGLGHLTDNRSGIRAEDFADFEDRGEAGDVSSRLDHAEVLRVHAGTLGELANRPPASEALAPQDRSEADGIRIGFFGQRHAARIQPWMLPIGRFHDLEMAMDLFGKVFAFLENELTPPAEQK